MATTNSKGKGKASPTNSEQEPLLPNPPSSATTIKISHGRGQLIDSDDEDEELSRRTTTTSLLSRPSRRSLFWSICGTIFFLILFLLAITHIWLGHLLKEQSKKGGTDLESMGKKGVLFQGPNRVDIRANEEGGGLIIELEGQIGINTKKALGWEEKELSKNWFKRREDKVARWIVDRVDQVAVQFDSIGLSGTKEGEQDLILIQSMEKVMIPLSYPSSESNEPRMDNLILSVPLSFPSPSALGTLVQRIWDEKSFTLKGNLKHLLVIPKKSKGLISGLIRKWGTVKLNSIEMKVDGSVPDVPSDPSDLVQLQKYDIFQSTSAETNETTVGLVALATLVNPLLDSSFFKGKLSNLAWGNPFRIPVKLYLPAEGDEDEILLAKVTTSPFKFTSGEKTTSISILGRLVSLASSTTSTSSISSSLSRFLANYIAGKDNTILLRYDPSPLPDDDEPEEEAAPYPPTFVSTMLENLTIPLPFPGSKDKLDFIKNLKIEDMKIRLSSFLTPLAFFDSLTAKSDSSVEGEEGDLLCSGRVVGEIMLPVEFEGLMDQINVDGILPDVYVYDGDLPDSALSYAFVTPQLPFTSSASIQAYPPTPIPINVFARLHPSSLIPSLTLHIPANSTHSATTLLTASFIDAPLFLLPGRSEVFRKFVGKILFGQGAKTSVKGISAVQVEVGGFGRVELEGVEVRGEFFVGKGGMGGFNDDEEEEEEMRRQ